MLTVAAGSLSALIAHAATGQTAHVQNQTVYDFRLGQSDIGPGPARPLGSMAPDFVLPTLNSYLNSAANPAVNTVRLSDFRGKKSVVLLFTGHT